jgi:heptaprenyl diphosphate synthase
MTRSVIELPVTADDRRIARLAALAIGLTLAEAAIPSPVPGVKPGLANIVVLMVLLQFGWRAAAWVSALRVLAGGLLLGSLFAPGFWLSAAGALASLAVLALARHLPNRRSATSAASSRWQASGCCRVPRCSSCCRCSPLPRWCSAP